VKYVTCPRNCFDGCQFVYKDDILVPRKDHPGTDGITCPKSRFLLDTPKHKGRITKPLLKIRGTWQAVSLDEALNIMARQIERHARTIRIDYSGNMMLLSRRFHHRLFHVLGAPDVRWDICAEAGSEGLRQSWEIGYGMDIEDMKGADLVIIWGANVEQTSIHAFTYALQTKRAGGKVFVVDVLRSETARHFELVRVNPGGDVALALQIMLVLKDEGYHVPIDIPLSADELASISGLFYNDVRKLAHAMKNAKKPFIFMGYGFQRRKGGGMAVRLISLLPYITHEQPLFYYDRPAYGIDTDYVSGKHLATGDVFSLTQMAEHIKDMEDTVFVIMNANPVNTLPKGHIIADVLERPSNFTIVHDLFMTDTARHADLIIPAAASVEYDDVMISYGHRYVGLNNKIYSPPEHVINNMDLAREIARRLGFTQAELYEEDWHVIEYVLKRAGVDIDMLMEKGYAPLPDIPTRKEPAFPQWCEIEKYLRPESNREKFMFLTPSYKYRIHSQYWVFKQTEDEVFISPDDAEALGIEDGDKVLLKNENGQVVATARISGDVMPGILKMFHGSWGSQLASLINIELSDIGPNSKVSDTFVSIEKLS